MCISMWNKHRNLCEFPSTLMITYIHTFTQTPLTETSVFLQSSSSSSTTSYHHVEYVRALAHQNSFNHWCTLKRHTTAVLFFFQSTHFKCLFARASTHVLTFCLSHFLCANVILMLMFISCAANKMNEIYLSWVFCLSFHIYVSHTFRVIVCR